MAGLKKRVLKRAAKAGVRKAKRDVVKAQAVRDLGTGPTGRAVKDIITGGPASAAGKVAAHGAAKAASAIGKRQKKR